MIETKLENRGWMPAVFRRAHHDDHIRRTCFVEPALAANPHGESKEVAQEEHHEDQSQ